MQIFQKRLRAEGMEGMERGRIPRKDGEIIVLGDTPYRLEAVEGLGGSVIVYRALYEDRLNRGYFHKVLIKELFPFHPKGAIYRDEDGAVRCAQAGRELLEQSRQSFLEGNRINLELLERMPAQISGNLNSYEAYGTMYSVLSVHGGRTLEQSLEDGAGPLGLKEAAAVIGLILNALECFHLHGLLHLDISPDNILLLPKQALLIDYNSIWSMERGMDERFIFSEKKGYTAPEVILREVEDISPATDLYSVCAVFFRMLVGRRPSEEELTGNGLGKCFPADLRIFCGEPATAAWKAAGIVRKGMHVLARRRYQSVSGLREDIEELIRRIDGRGISHSALWECSRRDWRRQGQPGEDYLERRMEWDDGEAAGEQSCEALLRSGGRILLTGPGGMGKTRFLMRLWQQGMGSYTPREPVPVYIPLREYQEADREPCFIRRFILGRLGFADPDSGREDALHEMERLFSQDDGGVVCVLLLDGLNEAGSHRRYLLREIEELGDRPGVAAVVTDRSDSVKEYGLYAFRSAALLPLDIHTAQGELARRGMSEAWPGDGDLLALLCNPMMLALYVKITHWREEDGQESSGGERGPAADIVTADDMIGTYLDALLTIQLRRDSGNQAEQLRHRYILTHLLPGAAGEMKRKKKTLLSLEELYQAARKHYRLLHNRRFLMAFPEYMGKTRQMMDGIQNENEWFDYAVAEQLVEQMGLLVKSAGGYYGLMHDELLRFLEHRDSDNRHKARRYRRGARGIWACAGILAAALLLLAGGTAVQRASVHAAYSGEDKRILGEALQRLLLNLHILDIQLYGQQSVLEEAGVRQVLEGEEPYTRQLKVTIGRKLEELPRYQTAADDGAAWVQALGQLKTGIPLDVLRDLYGKPKEMDFVMKEALGHLEEGLCGSESPYGDASVREALVEAYQAYLEAYARYCYAELSLILSYMDPESGAAILDEVSEMLVFKQYLLTDPPDGRGGEDLRRQLKAAGNVLEDAENEMRMQNYTLEGYRIIADG